MKIDLAKIFLWKKLKVYNLYLWEKEDIARYSFFAGMTIAFLGSLNPWFMWPLGLFYIIVVSMLFALSMAVSRSMTNAYFNRYDYIIPLLLITVLVFYQSFIRSRSLNDFIADVFHVIIFYSIF